MMARRLVLGQMESIREGRLEIVEGTERHAFGAVSDAFPVTARIEVRDPRFWSEVAWGGALGAAESYMEGDWEADDLTAAVRVLARNAAAAEGLERSGARLREPLLRLAHWLRRNTRTGSRRNIARHYDLGNEFFALFLDETLMYSCAVFPGPSSTLEEASLHKLDLVCRKLELGPGEDVLEIGTGWGGFALHAAGNYGAHVTTTTISGEQYRLARDRVREAGLEGRITVLREDYRDLPRALGRRFPKAVSIEMIEAVGHSRLGAFFRTCSQVLEPEGMMLLQAIVIADQQYEAYRRSVDFIRRHIFPGGHLPSITAICSSMTRASSLRLLDLDDITPHYAVTLRRWRDRFLDRLEDVRRQGFDDRFIRMWEFYLCYCEGGFLERTIGDVQMLLAMPLCRREPLAPAL